MKVLLVNGSPHQYGSTNRALTEVAATLKEQGVEIEIFWIGNKAISGCIGCFKCFEKGECIFKDIVSECYEKAKECDGFVFGTPVHYGSPAANMMCFMDRLFHQELVGGQNKHFRMKPAATVVSARRAGTTATFDVLNKYYTIQEMPIVSSCYWNNVHGNVPSETEQDEEGLLTMRTLGRNMAYILKCIEAGKEKGLEFPMKEEPKHTNFIR